MMPARQEPKDELLEHHEGQALFTLRRVIFAGVLVGVALGVGAWYVVAGGSLAE